jgi:hypothetical protein
MIRAPIQASLPYDPNQNLALRKGVPLGLAKPDSPLAVELQGFVQKLLRTGL